MSLLRHWVTLLKKKTILADLKYVYFNKKLQNKPTFLALVSRDHGPFTGP